MKGHLGPVSVVEVVDTATVLLIVVGAILVVLLLVLLFSGGGAAMMGGMMMAGTPIGAIVLLFLLRLAGRFVYIVLYARPGWTLARKEKNHGEGSRLWNGR